VIGRLVIERQAALSKVQPYEWRPPMPSELWAEVGDGMKG
jgi:hypothetical protein